ncbi:TRAP transporter small permease [Oceanobacillus arenosus]|uniref:TRAP transporter small permease n=1 Tax=Oceanobacillus arenosus TaxID=1229153 RepID=A0A3D8Q1Q3_9BACI|nr:TRAP transporter small permease [Oceanobacillus arenosus]RDW22153.1 TRAP transporter small permease [Oceanobacillus arenosus]
MKIIKWLDEHLEESLLIVLSTVMTASITIQVFMRYALNSSLTWSEELARYCFIWLVYIGISYGVKTQKHIKVDVVLQFMKNKQKIILGLIANLIFLAFSLLVIVYGYDIAQQLLGWGQTSPALHVPMGFVYMATPVGFAITSIRLIQQIFYQVLTLMGKREFEVKTEHDFVMEETKDDKNQK